jgi:ABC-type dipeptide/oligopeptide/nickel transport system permease subunit
MKQDQKNNPGAVPGKFDSEQKHKSVFALAPTIRRLSRSKSALFGMVVVLVLFITATLAPLISPHDKAMQYRSAVKIPPMTRISWDEINAEFEGVPEGQFHRARTNLFVLGTDKFGRDILSRVLYGAQISLIVGVVAEIIAILIGVTIGAIAGYFGGFLDSVLMRLTDTFFAFPSLLLAIGILAIFEKPGLFTVFVALGIVGWTSIARIVRGQVLSVKEEEFVEAARAVGASDARIILRHILPNSLAPIIVVGTLGIATNILSEAGLSFLGLGIQPPTPSWGIMLAEGRNLIESSPWICIFPGLAILLTVLGFNLLGDGLRDALDPRLKVQ